MGETKSSATAAAALLSSSEEDQEEEDQKALLGVGHDAKTTANTSNNLEKDAECHHIMMMR
jgi:hypothetical protein